MWGWGASAPHPYFTFGVVMPKKLDDIVNSLKRENPTWSESKVWAIAQSTYKKVKGRG
jgi:hypothetical protein